MRELVLLRHAGKRMRKRRLHVNKKSIDDWEQKHENEITDDAKGAKSNCTLTFNRSIFWDKLSGRLPSISWTWRGLCGAQAIRPRLGKIQSVLWKALYQFRFTGQYSHVLLEELAKICSTVIHDILYHNLCELDWQSCQVFGYLSKIIKLIQIRLNCNYLFLQALLRYWCSCISVAYLIAI